MTVYSGDQQTTSTMVLSGVHINASVATQKALAPSGTTVYTFTAPYVFVFQGAHLSYRKGAGYTLDAALKAALLAASAPMVAA